MSTFCPVPAEARVEMLSNVLPVAPGVGVAVGLGLTVGEGVGVGVGGGDANPAARKASASFLTCDQ